MSTRWLILATFCAACAPSASPGEGDTSAAVGAGGDPAPTVTTSGEVQVLDYGLVAAKDALSFPKVTFDVPPDTLSVTLYAQGDPSNRLNPILHIDGPQGDITKQIDAPGETSRVTSFTLPQSEAPLVPGRYTVTMPPFTAPHVWLIRRRGAQPTAGTINLNLTFLPGSGLDISDDAAQADMLATISALLAPAGITIGAIRQFSVLADTAAPYLDPRTTALQDDVRALSADRPAGLDVTFIHAFDAGDDGVYVGRLLGMAGGHPGAPTLHGLPGSGIVMAVGPLVNAGVVDGVSIGYALAHEIGHTLGLLHTTEASGSAHDPIADTPECPASNDADGDGKLLGPECTDYDAANVMFWNVRQVVRRQVTPAFSATQNALMLLSPLVVPTP